MGLRRPPYAFTGHGVAMLSSIQTSKRAVASNILIIQAFVRFREYLATHTRARLQNMRISIRLPRIYRLRYDQSRPPLRLGRE